MLKPESFALDWQDVDSTLLIVNWKRSAVLVVRVEPEPPDLHALDETQQWRLDTTQTPDLFGRSNRWQNQSCIETVRVKDK